MKLVEWLGIYTTINKNNTESFISKAKQITRWLPFSFFFFAKQLIEALTVIHSTVCLKNKQTNPAITAVRFFFFQIPKTTFSNTALLNKTAHRGYYRTVYNQVQRGEKVADLKRSAWLPALRLEIPNTSQGNTKTSSCFPSLTPTPSPHCFLSKKYSLGGGG